MWNGTIQWSRMMFGTCVALVLPAGTSRVDIKYLSVITITNWFPCLAFGSGSRKFDATNSSGPHDRSNWSGRFCLYWLPFLALLIDCATAAYTPFAMWAQYYSCLRLFYTRLSECPSIACDVQYVKHVREVFLEPQFWCLRQLSIFGLECRRFR